MNSMEQRVVDVLKWAVCPSRPAPAMDGLDEDALVELAQYHRIVQPLLSRLESARPSGCPPRLCTRLRVMQHHIRRHAQERMAAAREISQAMQTCGQHPPIFIKGFSAYALTNDPHLLHFSGDLDPLAEDLPALWDTAYALGYTGRRKDTHEWAKLTRAGITLDVHQHYLVLSYPDDVRTAPATELDASLNPGQWHLPTWALDLVPSGKHICWANLYDGAVPGVAEGTQGLLFPSPTLLCLIHCAHCFRCSVTRLHYINPLGGFHLYELLSIQALAGLPEFDGEQFQALVAQFAAQDTVQHVNTLAEALLGTTVVPAPKTGGLLPFGFPEHLVFGGWLSMRQPDDFLVLHGIEQVLDRLHANQASARCTLDLSQMPRLLLYGAQPAVLPQVNIVWNDSGHMLTMEWALADTSNQESAYTFGVYFGYGSSVHVEIDALHSVSSVRQKSDYLRYNRQATAEKISPSVIRMICPIPNFPVNYIGTGTLPLFLAVRQLSLDGISTQAASYLPLRLSTTL